MQQNQQERRFSDAPQQSFYRFPQNQPGYQQSSVPPLQENSPLTRRERSEQKRRQKRRKVFTWWNLFAIIGILTVALQLIRYAIIPFLVYLNSLTGGAL